MAMYDILNKKGKVIDTEEGVDAADALSNSFAEGAVSAKLQAASTKTTNLDATSVPALGAADKGTLMSDTDIPSKNATPALDWIGGMKKTAETPVAVSGSSEPTEGSPLERRVDYTTANDAQRSAMTDQWKQSALNSLKALYTGNWDKLVKQSQDPNLRIAQGTPDRARYLTTAVANINQATSEQDLADRLKLLKEGGNPFVDYVTNAANRKDWNKDYTNEGVEVPKSTAENIETTLFPNYALRTKNGSNLLSRGLGGAQDVFTIPTRAITAGIEQGPQTSQDIGFTQAMGRPDPYSNGGERFADFTMSSILPGAAEKKALGLLGEIKPLASAFSKIPVVGKLGETEKASQAVLSPYLGDAVTEVPWKEAIAKAALKGGAEGGMYSLFPSAVMATNPETTNPYRMAEAGANLVAGPVLGALGSGVAEGAGQVANKLMGGGRNLSEWGNELTGGYNSFNRLKEAAKGAPLSDSREGVEQITDLNKLLDLAVKKNAEPRNEVARASIPNWTPRSVASAISPKLSDVPSDIALFPGNQQTYSDLMSNMLQQYAKNPAIPTMEELVAMRTALGRLSAKTVDPEKGYIIDNALQSVKKYMQGLGEKSRVITVAGEVKTPQDLRDMHGNQVISVLSQKSLADKYAQLGLSPDLEKLREAGKAEVVGLGPTEGMSTVEPGPAYKAWMDEEDKRDLLEKTDPQAFEKLKQLENWNRRVGGGTSRGADLPLFTRTSDLLDPRYKAMEDIYKMKEGLVDPEGSEAYLSRLANARVNAVTNSGRVQDAVTNLQGIVKVLNDNSIPKPSGQTGPWALEDVDYITPAVVRTVRQRLKGEDGTAFQSLLNSLTGMSHLFGLRGMATAAVKPVLKSLVRGSGDVSGLTGEKTGDNERVTESPLFTTNK